MWCRNKKVVSYVLLKKEVMEKNIVHIVPQVEVRVIECGPLRIGGRVRIIMPDGSVLVKRRTFICSCGRSKTGLFCDGSHAL